MHKASPMTYLNLQSRQQYNNQLPQNNLDLNIFAISFKTMKQAQSNISGGQPYTCSKCKVILNKFSVVLNAQELNKSKNKLKIQLKNNQSFWQCQFCGNNNIIKIDKEQIPKKQDIVYLIQSQLQSKISQNDSTIIFCIDCSGSMNTTSQIPGKIDLKFGLSEEQITMLKQFMEPGDQAQFNFLPGNHNKNKTFISRKQCILSAIESQIKEIKKNDPNKKVGFITFNNQVTVFGDNKTATVNIVGDKLTNQNAIITSLTNFKLTDPLSACYETLIKNIYKQQAKGQTALGPAILSAIQIASKGNPGSTVILCTDGLANVGVGLLDPLTEDSKKFYQVLAQKAKEKNIAVNIMTIKGEGCKMEVIGKLAELTNGNMKVVNPEKLSDDFANVLKDQVVGMNVEVVIQLHKSMKFRNQLTQNLSNNASILKRKYANATVNTKITFEYQLRCQQDLKIQKINIKQLIKVPFQTQIFYTSPKGGRFLRVITSQSKTTTQKKQSYNNANIKVAHQRIAGRMAQQYSHGTAIQEVQHKNALWNGYLQDNFKQQKYQKDQQLFSTKNAKINKAIEHKSKKMNQQKKKKLKMQIIEQKKQSSSIKKKKQDNDSDQDQMQFMENMMQKADFHMEQQQQ